MMKKIIFLALSVLCVGAQDVVAMQGGTWQQREMYQQAVASGAVLRCRQCREVTCPCKAGASSREDQQGPDAVSYTNNPPRTPLAELYGSAGSVSASLAQQQCLSEAGYAEDGGQPCEDCKERATEIRGLKGINSCLEEAVKREAAKVERQNRTMATLFGIGGADLGVSGALYASKAYPKLEKHRLKLAAAGLFAGCTAGLLASRLCTEKPAEQQDPSQGPAQAASGKKKGMSRTKQGCWLIGGVALVGSGFAAYQWAQGHNYSTPKKVGATLAGPATLLAGAGYVLRKKAQRAQAAREQAGAGRGLSPRQG